MKKEVARFGYKPFPKPRERLRPVADVTLQNGKHKRVVYCLIDSGADYIMIPKQIGDLLGLKYRDKEITSIGGLSGNVKCVLKDIRMEIGDYNFSVKVCWALEDIPCPILGREDVFRRFKIIWNNEKEIIFKKI